MKAEGTADLHGFVASAVARLMGIGDARVARWARALPARLDGDGDVSRRPVASLAFVTDRFGMEP
jgi:hypothetical protein